MLVGLQSWEESPKALTASNFSVCTSAKRICTCAAMENMSKVHPSEPRVSKRSSEKSYFFRVQGLGLSRWLLY